MITCSAFGKVFKIFTVEDKHLMSIINPADKFNELDESIAAAASNNLAWIIL